MISGSASGVWTCSTQSITPSYFYNVLNNNYPILKYLVTREEDWCYDGRNVYKGSSKINSIKCGSTDIKYVYIGDTCVYGYNTGTQKILGSSYIVSHLFMEYNDTAHLSSVISSLGSAISFTSKMMLYEGFYIQPYLYKDESAVTTTSSNFTVDVWIKDKKLGKLNYPNAYVYYYDDPNNRVGVYLKSGVDFLKNWAGDFINDEITRIREGFLLFFNLSQFSYNDPMPSVSPGVSLLPVSKPLYRIQVSNTLDSLVVVGESGTMYKAYE